MSNVLNRAGCYVLRKNRYFRVNAVWPDQEPVKAAKKPKKKNGKKKAAVDAD